MTNPFYLYIHRRVSDGRVFYVGKGKDQRAWSTKRSAHWKRVAAKHGVRVEIVAQDLTEASAFELEELTIAMLRSSEPLVNMTDGGEGTSGWVHPEKARAKISQHAKSQWEDPCFRAKVSTTLKNRIYSAEVRANMSAAQKGKSPSAETRAKMSAAQALRHQREREALNETA